MNISLCLLGQKSDALYPPHCIKLVLLVVPAILKLGIFPFLILRMCS